MRKLLTRYSEKQIKSRSLYCSHGNNAIIPGIIGSSRYSEEENVSLPLVEPKQVLGGYVLTYKGQQKYPDDAEKYHFNVIVEKDDKGFLLQPIMYYSEYSEGIMKNPDIANLVTKDLYLSPMSLEEPGQFSPNDIINLKKVKKKISKG